MLLPDKNQGILKIKRMFIAQINKISVFLIYFGTLKICGPSDSE
jgi:hypothetical protein